MRVFLAWLKWMGDHNLPHARTSDLNFQQSKKNRMQFQFEEIPKCKRQKQRSLPEIITTHTVLAHGTTHLRCVLHLPGQVTTDVNGLVAQHLPHLRGKERPESTIPAEQQPTATAKVSDSTASVTSSGQLCDVHIRNLIGESERLHA